jgi:hypothetical protein
METKAKITFVLPDVLQKECRERIAKDGYDMRGKSRWLLSMRNYPELVYLSNQMKGFEKAESVVMTKDFKKLLDNTVVEIRKMYPAMEGVLSGILRTAIMQRILRS